MNRITNAARRVLDALYLACGMIAACCLVAILVLITLQMLARWTGEMLPGSTDYAGYFMAASSFFAFAYALNNGSHIRVNILLGSLGRHRRWAEIWCFAIGSLLAIYWARYAINSVVWSRKLDDVSQGLDATPLWIPQSAMAVGSVVFAIALLDNLVQVAVSGRHSAVPQQVDHSPPQA